ncbi:MAG TPA: serine/threonine-protein kinase [Kofleriaceae bacterium]|nr:serine/threonine-protein kinase [Kofleriaceae bacterium]
MSTGSGDKPGGGSSPGRPAADTPGRLVVRSLDGASDTSMGASDTAVAVATKSSHGMNDSSEKSLSATEAGPTPAAGMQALQPSATELTGVTLSGRYLVTRKVGQGGMGAVYEATHTLIGKRVAVKVLLEKYAQREAIVKRLKQEAQLASSIGNEHIIDITDFGNTDDGRTFVVMEFLEGESMAECLAKEPKLPEARILRIATQTASALAAAHAKGVVHRDIKPENIFLLKRKEMDFVKVVDFGISKSLRASGEEEEAVRLTQTGMVLGTPLYMSPEQARGDEDLDHRVDIYALGVIMYESATGRVPFGGNNYLSVISQVLNETPKPVREIRPELSDEFEAIVSKALAKDRNDRYANATDMLADLNALLDDPTHSTERAKITGPRRLLPKQVQKIPRIAWAISLAGIAVGAVTIAVVLLMGSKQKKQVPQPQVALHSDAGVQALPVIDAGEAKPAFETIKLTITSDPPKADIYRESELVGKAPVEIELVKNNDIVNIYAELPNGFVGQTKINPAERKNGATVPIKLKKQSGSGAKIIRPTGKGSASTGTTQTGTTNHTAGELSNNPYAGSGTVQNK